MTYTKSFHLRFSPPKPGRMGQASFVGLIELSPVFQKEGLGSASCGSFGLSTGKPRHLKASTRATCSMRPPSGVHPVGIHDARLPDAAGGQRIRLFYPVAPGVTGSGPPRWMPPSEMGTFVDETAMGFARYALPPIAAQIGAVGFTSNSVRSVG